MSDAAQPAQGSQKMSATGATFLGIGAMIGAGIFALLGEAGAVAGSAVWISFLLGAVVTSLLAYMCMKLGIKYPSSGGLIYFVEVGFGKGRLVGITAWLGYISASVITCSMVAVSFGSYGATLFVGEDAPDWVDNAFTTGLVVGVVLINFIGGAGLVARAQMIIVGLVLASFTFFIVTILPSIDLDLLKPSDYPSLNKIVASVALTFFAYMGFNVITFAAGDLQDPKKDLPRAMTQSIGVTAVTYVLIAICVFGTLSVAQVIMFGETAIAEAARPQLGDFGFTLMAATALLSTAGATNAMLYAAGNLTGVLAEEGLFPPFFGAGTFLGKRAGLLISAAIVLVIGNTVDLSAIASVGSAVALVLFLVIGAAAWKLRVNTESIPAMIIAAVAVTIAVLGFFAVNTARDDPETFVAIIVVVILALALELTWEWYRSNKLKAGDASA